MDITDKMLAETFGILAILGGSGIAALAEIAERQSIDLVEFHGYPGIRLVGKMVEMEEEIRVSAIALMKQQPAVYSVQHHRVLNYLAAQLKTDHEAAEPEFLAVFERLGNHLLTNPEQFVALVDFCADVPLSTPGGKHLRLFFEGVACRKNDHYAESLHVFEALLHSPDLDAKLRGRTLNSAATVYRLVGQYEKAIMGYVTSVKVWREQGNRLREGLAHLNLGIVYYELQDYTAAEKELLEAKTTFEIAESAQWQASVNNELGVLYRDLGRWTQAIQSFEAYVAQRQREDAADEVGRGLNNIGEVLLFQGDIEQAVVRLKAALGQMTTRVYRIDAYMHLGLAYQARGALADARKMFQQAYKLAIDIDRRDILPHIYLLLGEVSKRLDDDETALHYFQNAAELVESTRLPMRDAGLKISLLGRWQQIYETLILHCLSIGLERKAFAWAERARARAFAEAVGATQEQPGTESDNSGEISPMTVKAIQGWLADETTVLCYFSTGVLDREIPMLRAIPTDNPLRDHLLTPPRIILFEITASSFDVQICPLDPNILITTSPRRHDRSRFLQPSVLTRLSDAFLKPTRSIGAATHLTVVSHGPLHLVPFTALQQNGQPLIRKDGPTLAFSPSASTIPQRTTDGARIASRTCLTIGYGGTQAANHLRHTEPEARYVAYLTDGDAWTGADVTVECLQRAAPEYRWLHFACHGQYNDEDPLASFLEIGENVRLTALEVMQNWQLCADLVTLSACQTGVSKVLRGDEPMGLIRAFMTAGAKALLVTHWPVDDLTTFLLMQRFYQGMIDDTGNPANALRIAQIWLRDLNVREARQYLHHLSTQSFGILPSRRLEQLPSDARPFASPQHWAAFVLVV